MRLVLVVMVVVAAAVAVAALARGGDDPAIPQPEPARTQPPERAEPPPLRPARCPPDVAGCRSVTGRIVLVESVDPDGDGDLHVVVADGGISLPGLTAVDVRPGLRPRRDPRVGDRATAAGPVQRGSYGQAQIHALRFRVQR